jgi:hypothetical protein
MKAYKFYFSILLIGFLMTSCFDDHKVLFEKTQVEFETAVTSLRATGEIFPIINVNRADGTPTYQVNLIGEHLEQAEDISFSLDEVPDRLLNATTIRAIEGVHFTLNGSTLTFPAQSSVASFAGFTITAPQQTGMTALLIIKLDGNERIEPAENFRRLGIRINLN